MKAFLPETPTNKTPSTAHACHFLRQNISINLLIYNIQIPVGRGVLHQFRQGHQLAQLRRLRRRLPQRQQLAVVAVHRSRPRQSPLHRDPVHDTRLLAVPRQRAVLQGDVQSAVLRVRCGDARTAALAAGVVQADW